MHAFEANVLKFMKMKIMKTCYPTTWPGRK